MHATLHRLFRYKAWADEELLATLAGLGATHPIMPLALKALAHVHAVDRIFAAHLRCEPHDYASANPEQTPLLDVLTAQLRASDREYLAYVPALDDAQLWERIAFAFTDSQPGCMSREEMLLHVINHGSGHRGQVSALLLLHGLAPARDGFTTWLHEAEAATRGRGARRAAAEAG
ncbi:MAG TPA: DinB family protein [Xanthomonadaceae bacterium]|nr:DinB family protein [Xanthomonadaceae bacterium]